MYIGLQVLGEYRRIVGDRGSRRRNLLRNLLIFDGPPRDMDRSWKRHRKTQYKPKVIDA